MRILRHIISLNHQHPAAFMLLTAGGMWIGATFHPHGIWLGAAAGITIFLLATLNRHP